MIENLLQEIVSLENEQDCKVKESIAQAKDIVANAKAKAVEIELQTDAKIKNLDKANCDSAIAQANMQCDKIIADADKQVKEIFDIANNKTDEIIAEIARRLEEKYA